MTDNVTITVNGREYTMPAEACYRDAALLAAAADPQSGAGEALLVKENNRLRELYRKPADGAEVSFLTYRDKDGRNAYRRTLCMMMRKAISDLFGSDPDYDVTVHFSVDGSFFCSLANGACVTDEFLRRVEERMKELSAKALPIRKKTVSTEEAMRFFHEKGLLNKEQLFRYRISSFTNLYDLDGFQDYYYGYMLDNTAQADTFRLKRYEFGFLLMQPALRGGETAGGSAEPVLSCTPRKKVFDIQIGSKEWGRKIGIRDVGDLNDQIVSEGVNRLILVQEAYHEQQIAAMASRIIHDSNCRFVMIAGPSSSGKTTFSHRLSAQLAVHGITPHPLPLDDYFLDREKTPRNPDGSYNFECLEAIDTELFNQNMCGLLEGKEVELPSYNFKTGRREYRGKKLRLGENDIMVIEGIHGLNDALSYALPAQNKCRIYISALTQLSVDEHDPIPTTDGRLIRRIVRDARTRGTSAAGTIAMWSSVRRGEENYIFPFQESADMLFNSALIYELAVLKVYAEPLLFGIDRSSPEYMEARRLLKFLDYFVPVSPENIPVNSLVREFIGGSCFDV